MDYLDNIISLDLWSKLLISKEIRKQNNGLIKKN